jgi:hypothetical protein
MAEPRRLASYPQTIADGKTYAIGGSTLIDIDWFMGVVQREGIILRLQIDDESLYGKAVYAHAFTSWVDRMGRRHLYVVNYGYGSDTVSASPRADLLVLHPFPEHRSEWKAFLNFEADRDWSFLWNKPQTEVCIRRTLGPSHEIPVCHPEVISHLSRFATMAEEGRVDLEASTLDPSTFVDGTLAAALQRLNPDRPVDSATAIVARRLNGLINAQVKRWEKMISV